MFFNDAAVGKLPFDRIFRLLKGNRLTGEIRARRKEQNFTRLQGFLRMLQAVVLFQRHQRHMYPSRVIIRLAFQTKSVFSSVCSYAYTIILKFFLQVNPVPLGNRLHFLFQLPCIRLFRTDKIQLIPPAEP